MTLNERYQIKEIRLRPKIAEHDLQIKIRSVRRLLPKNLVKVQVFFKGREHTHIDLGLKLLRRVIDDAKDISIVDSTGQYFVVLKYKGDASNEHV